MKSENELVAVIDFGSQYTQLIARRVREQNVYCEIYPCTIDLSTIKSKNPRGIILSGGPASVYQPNAPTISKEIFSLNVPILGICYGMQIGCKLLGCEVKPATAREYGLAQCHVSHSNTIFNGLPSEFSVWMSHGDVVSIPDDYLKDFVSIANTRNAKFCAVKHKNLPFYGLQFHPEVVHTQYGSLIIKNFLFEICKCSGRWSVGKYVEETIKEIRDKVGSSKVICAISGGVDSTLTAVLVNKAIGDNLICVFVDNGLLRKDEAGKIENTLKKSLYLNLICVDASEIFLERLKNVTNPEEKRKIIGTTFIEVFENKAKEFKNVEYIAQGTLYPDVIESQSVWGGPTSKIKSHHNVGGLPEKLNFKLLEPLKYLFKDEVREVARQIGLAEEIISRQPFPGPGLAVRIIGEVTKERVKLLQDVDAIVVEEIEKAGINKGLWQYFAVLLPVKSVGVMGDERTYESVVAIRCVESTDGMTADWFKIPYDLLGKISNRIVNEVKGVNRVVYDVTSKPPATIEWE